MKMTVTIFALLITIVTSQIDFAEASLTGSVTGNDISLLNSAMLF